MFKKLYKKKHNDELDAIVYATDTQELIGKMKKKYRLDFDSFGGFAACFPKPKFNIDEWQGKYMMYFENQEDLLKFYDYLHSVGRRWYTGSTYKEFRPVVDGIHRRVRYLYFNNGTYGFENDPFYKIINFKDFDWSDVDMRKTKFKAGDKVRVVSAKTKDKQKFIGRVFTINYCSIGGSELYDSYAVHEVDGWRFFNIELELFNKKTFTKADLKPGMVVEVRDGARYLFVNEMFVSSGGYLQFISYNDDLTHATYDCLDVVKIFDTRGTEFGNILHDSRIDLIWKREEVKEMTVAEIEEKLGYKVKIVDGE